MYYNYEKAMKITIPAVRAAVSVDLDRNHKMSETDIAKSLGIAQAAVSKYLSGNYSKKIGSLVKFIESKNLQKEAVGAILSKKGGDYIMNRIDSIASDKSLVKIALGSRIG